MTTDALVVVYFPTDTTEASAIEQALKDAGIPCHLAGDAFSGIFGAGYSSGMVPWRVRVMVPADRAAAARKLIEDGVWPNTGLPDGDDDQETTPGNTNTN